MRTATVGMCSNESGMDSRRIFMKPLPMWHPHEERSLAYMLHRIPFRRVNRTNAHGPEGWWLRFCNLAGGCRCRFATEISGWLRSEEFGLPDPDSVRKTCRQGRPFSLLTRERLIVRADEADCGRQAVIEAANPAQGALGRLLFSIAVRELELLAEPRREDLDV